jgi:hypothetical protein
MYRVSGLSLESARQVLPFAPIRPDTARPSAARSHTLVNRPELADTVTLVSGRTVRAPSGGVVAIWAGLVGRATGVEGAADVVGATPAPGAAPVSPPHPISSIDGSTKSTVTARRVRT